MVELTAGMRALTVLFAFVGEVENGGFEACLYNGTARWTAEAISSAKLIGATQHAQTFERFSDLASRSERIRNPDADFEALLESMSEAELAGLEALDEEFLALPHIDAMLNAYVDAHPGEFFID